MASFYSGDHVGAVVADIGAYATKIGWAGDDYPRSYFRSNVAVRRQEQQQQASSKKKDKDNNDKSKPKQQQQRRPIADVCYDYYTRPIDRDNDSDGDWEVCNPVDATTGLWYDDNSNSSNNSNDDEDESKAAATGGSDGGQEGADWYDLLQTFIRHGYRSALGSSPDKHPLLLIERSYNPPPIRQQVLECLFEELNVPATFLARDAALSCYGCGRTTGTVVDWGYSGTTVTPVYEGYVEQKGIRRSPVGVKQMDELILQYMDQLYMSQQQQRGVGSAPPIGNAVMPLYQVKRPGHKPRQDAFHKAARLQLALECREMGAGAAMNTNPAGFHAPHKSFELPDGTTILDIPSANRFAVADLLLGNDEESVQRREELLQTRRKEYSVLIADASREEDEVAGDNNNADEMYSDAAAVGISKRRTKRGAAAAAAKQQQPAKKTAFSNRRLQKACAPYLQNQVDHLTASAVASMICDAAYRCDRDQQVALLGNVVVGGGGSCLGPTEQTVPDVIREQVEGIIHTHTPGWRVKVLAPGMQERSILSWLGGSILGSLGTFHDMWITRAEYDEWGTAIVNRKCP